MNFEHDYLNKQIITYLGNKRKLIQFIDETVNKIIISDEQLKIKKTNKITFFDIFSGSGIVARYAKIKGFKVYTNDLEVYSKIINEALLNTSKYNLNDLFSLTIKHINYERNENLVISKDCYQTVLDYLNSLKLPHNTNSFYFSKHYAPKNTNDYNFDTERLFYTQENALKIDAIVELIFNEKIFNEKTKNIILASLMYNMTKHINTSGTMKGFHNGWGGPTKTSLHRILADINLEKLPLLHGSKAIVFQNYAEKVFIEEKIPTIDIIYADPPYNQHQYSANYNHLTTVCKNDKYDPGEVILGSRAGIRKDHSRSNFCKSIKNSDNIRFAEQAFIEFINNIKCKYLIVSYNNEGILNIQKLLNILSNNFSNSISVEKKIYSKFKGGKNTTQSTSVIEYLFIIKMNCPQTEKDFNLLKEELSTYEQKHLFLNKFIDYNLLDDTFTVIKNKDFTIVNNLNGFLFKIDTNSYKVYEENSLALLENEIIIFKECEMDKEQLINKYIEDNNIYLAKKIITSFNIKKYKDKKEFYIKKIEAINEKS